MDDELRRRLRRIGMVKGFRELEEASEKDRRSEAARSDGSLPGERISTPEGPVWVERAVYASDFRHGRYPLAHLAALPDRGLDLIERPDLGNRPAFLDTETTGLAGGTGTLAFLVGVGVWEGDELHTHLIFMRDPDDEPAALHYLSDLLSASTAIVTFNGQSFDLPILETRFVLNRIPPACLDLPHLDLLPLARLLWRDHLPSRRLVVLEEEILQVVRSDEDLPSSLIPYLYRQYLETGDPTDMKRIFYHNRIDVLSLATLLWHSVQMVLEPAGLELAAGEWAGVGRVYDRAGLEALAIDAWHVALSGEMGELDEESARRLWQEIGLRHKRRDRWESAFSVWDAWISRIRWAVSPLVEEAKYYEWVAKELEPALNCTQRALRRARAWPTGIRRSEKLAELEHREDRLRRKLCGD